MHVLPFRLPSLHSKHWRQPRSCSRSKFVFWKSSRGPVCHKMKAELIHGKASGHNEEEALVECHGDEDKVLTESQDEDRAKALRPFPVFRHKGIGCSEAPK